MCSSDLTGDFIQDELLPFNITPVPLSSPTKTSNPSIASQERALRNSLPEFRVIRSKRRKRSIHALRQNGAIEIHIPDRLSRREEMELIPEMVSLVLTREAKSRRSDEELQKWAAEVKAQYLPEFTEEPASISWRNMRERWGSCTTVDRTIRISERLANAPIYVIKNVILHELIHLRIADHGAQFTALMNRSPDHLQAEAYLEGFEHGTASSTSGNSDIS